MKSLSAVFLGIVLLTASAGSAEEPAPDEVEGMLTGGFPEYPGLKKFTTESIRTTAKDCLMWSGYWSPDPLETVIEHYSKLLGTEVLEREKGAGMWRFPIDMPKRVLDVRELETNGPHQSHRDKIPPEARTIVIASTMNRVPCN